MAEARLNLGKLHFEWACSASEQRPERPLAPPQKYCNMALLLFFGNDANPEWTNVAPVESMWSFAMQDVGLLLLILIVGFVLGYATRASISHHHRVQARRRIS